MITFFEARKSYLPFLRFIHYFCQIRKFYVNNGKKNYQNFKIFIFPASNNNLSL